MNDIEFKIAGSQHFEEMAAFIAQYNAKPTQHYLQCGQTTEEVLADLKDYNSKGEERFILAFNADELVGLIGGDSDHNPLTEIWLWGPFVDKLTSPELKQVLFNQLRLTFPSIKKMTAFYNIENIVAKAFYKKMGFTEAKQATHEYVCIQSNFLASEYSSNKLNYSVHQFDQSFKTHLIQLHETAFPKAYYSVEEMISLQNEQYKLWIITEQQDLIAYIFANITPNKEGFVHFLAVNEKHRKKGMGTCLLQKALHFFFIDNNLRTTYLTVSSKNNARKLYEKLNFTLRYTGKGAFWNVE